MSTAYQTIKREAARVGWPKHYASDLNIDRVAPRRAESAPEGRPSADDVIVVNGGAIAGSRRTACLLGSAVCNAASVVRSRTTERKEDDREDRLAPY